MRNQILATLSVLTLVSTGVTAQTAIKSSEPRVGKLARAIEYEERARALHSKPERAAEAARLYRWSAQLREPTDPNAVASLALGAYMFGYAGLTSEARQTMELAGERALQVGNVERAAQAFVDAAFYAEKEKRPGQVDRLGRKALLLAGSHHLTSAQKGTIRARIQSHPALANLVK